MKPYFAALAVSAIMILPMTAPLHAQSADLVLCDRLAADSADPDKPADVKGVASVAAADVATAIKFCKQASGSRRAMYQLGRAYAAAGQNGEAIGAWRKAADKGSTSAMVELGVFMRPEPALRKMKPQPQSCLSAQRRAAILAASATSRRSRARAAHRPPILSARAACLRKPPRPMPRRNSSSG